MTERYVFGYGSLVSPESVAATLGHDVDASRFHDARLAGWTRAWNVGTNRESHPERRFYLLPGRTEFTGVTAVLGIEPAGPEQGCDGVVFPVDEDDLSLLDVRERNYERIDVTGAVSWAGRPADRIVHTYAPRPEAVRRLAVASRRNVRRAYAELVAKAFAGRHRAEELAIPFEVVDMEVVIDPIQ